ARSCSGSRRPAAPAAAVPSRRPSSSSRARRATSWAKNPKSARAATVAAIVPASSRTKSRRAGRTSMAVHCAVNVDVNVKVDVKGGDEVQVAVKEKDNAQVNVDVDVGVVLDGDVSSYATFDVYLDVFVDVDGRSLRRR